ncbi:MAG: tRNA (guanosine(37)-N1)-methyltransferase TrmD [Phycisphaerales bacterium]|nr:tRNA (guanosine(37)-N1)-methyltransferase TrmD [Phycisphaerales bacterium]
MRIDVLTTFPELFSPEAPGVLGVSIPKRVIDAGLIEVYASDIRAFADNKHNKTDDRPFGGGPGMVMMCQPVWDAVQAVEEADPTPTRRILLTPQGQPLTQELVEQLANEPRLLMIAGHYEGIDERVIEKLEPLEISIGDYVLSGGELAALVLIDAIARVQPGALGHADSATEDSFSTAQTTDAEGNPIRRKQLAKLGIPDGSKLLDCPHYTRPRIWEGMEVPEQLLSGDHEAVAIWRLQQRLDRTRERRPDLLQKPNPDTLS